MLPPLAINALIPLLWTNGFIQFFPVVMIISLMLFEQGMKGEGAIYQLSLDCIDSFDTLVRSDIGAKSDKGKYGLLIL